MNDKHTIMVADDHQLFLDGMIRILEDEPDFDIIGFFNNGVDLLRALHSNLPDIVILDVQMPKLNGIEISLQIKERYPSIKILFVSMFDSSALIKQGKAAGVSGFISKTSDAFIVKNTIRDILNGKEIFIQTEPKIPEHTLLADSFLLSKREREIIQLIKKGYRTKKIADELNISSYTVETHRKNIFRKIKVNSVSELVSFAFANDL